MQATIAAAPDNAVRVSLSPRDIPPLQTTLMELLGIANDPEVSFDRLQTVIARDQALTMRLLAVANSSYYGCSSRVDSVRTAIGLLGTRQVQNIASAMALAPAFESAHGPALWAHGLATAVWTRHVMQRLGSPMITYLFTAGLIHDIGLVLLLRNAPDEAQHCLLEAGDDPSRLVALERQRMGTDHATIGASACVAWKLPDRVVELVGGHHAEHQSPASETADGAVLALAEALATHTGVGELGKADTQAPWPDDVLRMLALTEDDLSALLERSDEVCAEAGAFS